MKPPVFDLSLSREELDAQYVEYHRQIDRRWRETNREKDRSRKRDHHKQKSWELKAAQSCNRRARQKNLPYGMKPSDLYTKETGELPEFCPLFPHIRLDYNQGPDRRLWASVDKIVPQLGYTTGNVWVISLAANVWKSNGSSPQERRIITDLMAPKLKCKPLNDSQLSLF